MCNPPKLTRNKLLLQTLFYALVCFSSIKPINSSIIELPSANANPSESLSNANTILADASSARPLMNSFESQDVQENKSFESLPQTGSEDEAQNPAPFSSMTNLRDGQQMNQELNQSSLRDESLPISPPGATDQNGQLPIQDQMPINEQIRKDLELAQEELSLDQNQEIQHSENTEEEKEEEEEEPEDLAQEGARAFIVFGAATVIAAIYFYIKFKKIRDKERIHYGILDDREFELRHLSMSSDEEVGYSMRGTDEVNNPRRGMGGSRGSRKMKDNSCMDSSGSESEDATVYSNKRMMKKSVKGKKQYTEYV